MCCIIGELIDMIFVFIYKGYMSIVIWVIGCLGYSFDFECGLNVIEVMYKMIIKLLIIKEELKNKYLVDYFEILYFILNFGYIYGGDNVNCICGCCEMYIDMWLLFGLSV